MLKQISSKEYVSDDGQYRIISFGSRWELVKKGFATYEAIGSFDECKKKYIELSSGRMSWNDIYINIAKIVAKRSKDPHTKVGCVIVKNNQIVSMSYNGEPRDFNKEFDWSSNEKYDYIVHAEMNAFINASKLGVSCENADVYVTLSPCKTCMLMLSQIHVKTIYFIDKYRDFDESLKIAESAGIKLVQLK